MYTKWKDQILNYYVYIHIYLISTIINSLTFLFHVYCPHFFFGQLSRKYPDGYLCFSFFKRGSTKGMVSLLCMSSKYSQPQIDGCEWGKTFRLHGTTWDYMGLLGTAWALAQSVVPQPIMAKYWSGSLHLKQKWLNTCFDSLNIKDKIFQVWFRCSQDTDKWPS